MRKITSSEIRYVVKLAWKVFRLRKCLNSEPNKMIDSFKYPGKLFQNLEQFARVFKIAATDS